MPDRHSSVESVKSYLLGSLDEHTTAAMELLYFSDARFLERVKGIETELIEEYLSHRLSAEQARRFEERYFTLPELKERYEEVRRQRNERISVTQRPGARYPAFALGALALAAILIAPWIFSRFRSQSVAQQTDSAPVMTIRLTPGVVQGDRSRQVEFALPATGLVRFQFELPGRVEGANYEVVFSPLAPGQGTWNSRGSSPGGGQLEIDVGADHLQAGDWIARVSSSGAVVETYSFRVLPAQPK